MKFLDTQQLIDYVRGQEQVWIFAYGSLMFRSEVTIEERVAGRLSGYRRSMSQLSTDHRGSPERPGRVVSLRADSESACYGELLRLHPRTAVADVARLEEREKQGYQAALLSIEPKRGPAIQEAICFVAPPGNPYEAPELPLPELAELIREAEGPSGSNAEYVLQLAEALSELNLDCPLIFSLANALIDPDGAFSGDEQS